MELSKYTLIFCVILFQIAKSLKFLYKSTDYSPSQAKTFWYYAVATYCEQTKIQKWDVSTVSQLYPNVHEISVFYNSSGENLFYSAYDAENDLIVLAIRGSANIENWNENLDAFKTNYEKCNGCQVHTGFLNAYINLRRFLLSSMWSLRIKHPLSKVAVIGHSLGGAIATLAFVELFEIFLKIDYFYTFGSPRVGNENFSKYINSNFKDTSKFRVTHNKDPVPHLPLAAMGFFHTDREVFYNEDSSSFIVCKQGEDPDCANQFIIYQPDISDHLGYMAFSQHDFKKNCQ